MRTIGWLVVAGAAASVSCGSGEPVRRCAGIAPPDTGSMRQFVHELDRNWFACLPGAGDANGTLAFPRMFNDPGIHGFAMDVVNPADPSPRGRSLGTVNGLALFQQPSGFAAVGGPGYLGPRDSLYITRWDSAGDQRGETFWTASGLASAAVPAGGVLLAGDLVTRPGAYAYHAAAMLTGADAFNVKWGPALLASAGMVLGVGVDQLQRTLVITDGAAKFGPGHVSAQWFDPNGAPLTGEFILLSGFVAAQSTRLEASPLIGGGLVVRRLEVLSTRGTHRADALVVVESGKASVQPVPGWMTARADTVLQVARGGRAYAVLPVGRPAVACTQRVEVLAPDGTSCGAADYFIAAGTCDTQDLKLAADGTVIQLLPESLETTDPIHSNHTCTWRWWPGALR